MKVVTVVGARPQFVKAAMVSRELALHGDMEEVLIHTGQHFDENMSQIFFRQMAIPRPRYEFNINSMSHGAMTGRMLEKIEEALTSEKPDVVIVYGDTNSTLAGALAARKLNLKLVHVEAGLRSFNMSMPEEVNRILTDRISDILCCPTVHAAENLRKEGYEHSFARVEVTGDVMQDASIFFRGLAGESEGILRDLPLRSKDFVLCTIHRAENTNDIERLKAITEGLNLLSREIDIVLPLHPRTRQVIDKNQLKLDCLIIQPVGYLDMVRLLTHCKAVLTDSGGLQKEAFFFGKPCITLRDETEWVELIQGGFNILTGADSGKMVAAFSEILQRNLDFQKDFYGQGKAARNIAELLVRS